MKCDFCKSEVQDRDVLLCSKCRIDCHFSCQSVKESNFRKMSAETKSKWICLNCKSVGAGSKAAGLSSSTDSEKEAIKSMLFGLGDSSKPLLTTAKMIETVLLQQMTIFLVQVEEIAMRRDSSKIEMQDIVFLMRNDKAKLTRLLNFINFKDTKGRCKTGVVTANGHIKMKLSKRIYDCLQFLKAIGITGVCDPSADDDLTSKERLVRIQN
ncbi:uncharacterized protein LOC111054550 isoform X1 [Nilaparvata lugens]|uniref:uncharacterized protein LOC111054550 isoform X1 n=1 Tax=Nilaparvata lugens TaxID=108931 RepID=UPI00193DF555|nr:uncharacterized protein LOC111054550 isoform X1 [Nilaparvata lugens]